MGLWDITLDKSKTNFVTGLDYAKSHNLKWHSSGDYYPYPSAAWRLDAVQDPDGFNLDLSFSPEALYREVSGDLQQLIARGVTNAVWEPSSGRYFNAVKLSATQDSSRVVEKTKKCREAFSAGAIDVDGYRNCLARVAAEHHVD